MTDVRSLNMRECSYVCTEGHRIRDFRLRELARLPLRHQCTEKGFISWITANAYLRWSVLSDWFKNQEGSTMTLQFISSTNKQ
ncbi:hypothetical protein ACTXT7_010034 [Hymenolepis weldensis]